MQIYANVKHHPPRIYFMIFHVITILKNDPKISASGISIITSNHFLMTDRGFLKWGYPQSSSGDFFRSLIQHPFLGTPMETGTK